MVAISLASVKKSLVGFPEIIKFSHTQLFEVQVLTHPQSARLKTATERPLAVVPDVVLVDLESCDECKSSPLLFF